MVTSQVESLRTIIGHTGRGGEVIIRIMSNNSLEMHHRCDIDLGLEKMKVFKPRVDLAVGVCDICVYRLEITLNNFYNLNFEEKFFEIEQTIVKQLHVLHDEEIKEFQELSKKSVWTLF